MSAENMVSMVKVACQTTDIERMYECLDIPIPPKMRVAMYLVDQFETMDFNFEVVYREDKLQAHYEGMLKEEVEKVCGVKGTQALKQAFPKDYGSGGGEPKIQRSSTRKSNFGSPKSPSKGSYPQSPSLLSQMQKKSYLGDACVQAIEGQMEKMVMIDARQAYVTKEKLAALEERTHVLEADIASYQMQADQLESELEALLGINGQY